MKRIVSMVVILSFTLMTTGCWDYRELNELAVVVAMGIDKTEDGKYKLSFQVANPEEISQEAGQVSGDTPITTYTAIGSNEIEAIRKATTKVPRRMFFAHKRLIVVSEAVAREGIGPWMDVIERDAEGRIYIPVLVARKGNSAEAVLSILSPLERVPAKHLFDQLQTHSENYGETYPVEVMDLLKTLTQRGQQPVLTGVTIIGDPAVAKEKENVEHTLPLAKLKLDGMAILNREGKLIRWLDSPVSRGLSFVNNKIDNTIVSLDCNGNKDGLGVEIYEVHTTIRPEWKRGRVIFHLHTTGEGEVSEVHCPMNLADPKTIDQLEKTLSREVTGEIRQVARIAQQAGSDVLGLGESLHKQYPDLWERWEKEWDRRFSQVEVRVSSAFHIRRTGVRINPHQEA